MESMGQRVVRQAKEIMQINAITIATNASQIDIITQQLGDTISIVTEPERRDTFPAVALAISYLKFSKGCNNDEVIVIMPCDPYTDAGYFRAIAKMIECVEQNVADLVLMGIKPTYPSEKYGYRRIKGISKGIEIYRETIYQSCQGTPQAKRSLEWWSFRLPPWLHDGYNSQAHSK